MKWDDAPEPVRRIWRAIARQWLSRCEREGVAYESFLAAMYSIIREKPSIVTEQLMPLAFERAKAQIEGVTP